LALPGLRLDLAFPFIAARAALIVKGAAGNQSHVFEVRHPDADQGWDLLVDHDIEDYAIIGSGAWSAMASLAPRGGKVFTDAVTAIYRCCEAKFCAETASGVGQSTTVMIHRPSKVSDGSYRTRTLTQANVNQLRQIWKDDRDRPIPDQANYLIQDRLNMGKFMDD
jgi:hypothetical protein